MKKVILATALAGALVFNNVQASPSVPQEDLDQIFTIKSVTKNNQLSILSTNEMRGTVGDGWFSDLWDAITGSGGSGPTTPCKWWMFCF